MNLTMKTNFIIQIEKTFWKTTGLNFPKKPMQKKTINKKRLRKQSKQKEARDLITKINRWSLLNHEFIFYKQV